MIDRVAAALQVTGVAALTAAGWMISAPLGLAVAGAGLVLFGISVERDG